MKPSLRSVVRRLRPMASLVLLLASLPLQAETVWWEAENASQTNMPKAAEDPATISGGQWLYGKVADGLQADYAVTVKEGGRYSFLARRFWLHGAFRWRFDEGDWVTVEGLHQTVLEDMPKASKAGNATWVDLGYVTLTPGAHNLHIELVTKTTFQFNTLFGFDCFVLSNEGFTPKGIDPAGGPKQPPVKIDETDFGKFLPRTMALLESATPDHHTPISILFYGQSIIANSTIDQELLKFLHEKYPNAKIKSTKLAIGGYQAPILRKTSWQDLYPQNPDLVVFHDYGGEGGELEEIYRGIRSNMTTEVLTWTHHVDNFGNGIDQQREASCIVLKSLAAKYEFELADVRTQWKEYLKTTHLSPADLLADKMIHLNVKGTALLAEFLIPHFRVNANASHDEDKQIQSISFATPPKEVTFDATAWTASAEGLRSNGPKPLRIAFVGNRVDLTALPGETGSAKILLDGQTPSTMTDTLAASRSTIAPGAWWPVVTLVTLGANRIAETYTMNFHDVAPDGSSYAFDVTGSLSGDEGSGKSGVDFVAKSGHFTIKAEDIALNTVKKITKKDLPAQFPVVWDMHSMSQDDWKAPAQISPGAVPQQTVIRCWTDGPHTLEIIPNDNSSIGLKSATIFSPKG